MPRARSNVPRLKRKKQIMKAARGAFGAPQQAVEGGEGDRRARLEVRVPRSQEQEARFPALWIIRINAGARQNDMSYSVFMNGLKQGRHRSRPQDPRRPRGPRSGGVYRARRQGAHRAERCVT